jgi:nitrogen fixation protein NifU and related proteins
MSELDNLYREVILDHYKNPRGHGVIEGADVEAEGMNPLCGDEVSIFVSFDGDKIEDVKFRGRGSTGRSSWKRWGSRSRRFA